MISQTKPYVNYWLNKPTYFLLIVNLFVQFQLIAGRRCPEPKEGKRHFIRVGPRSRFLYPNGFKTVANADIANSICRKVDLEPADLYGVDDFRYLTKRLYYKNNKIHENPLIFNIDGKDKEGETGVFRSVSTGNRVSFLAFMLTPGHSYFDSNQSCLSIYCSQETDCRYKPHPCQDERVIPLCQYKEGSKCSRRYGEKQREEEQLLFLGKTSNNIFYGANRQKTRKEALSYCQKMGFNLLSFTNQTDANETTQIYEMLNAYKEKIGIIEWMGLSWTSGKFRKKYSERKPIAFTLSKPYDEKISWTREESEGYWKWQSEEVADKRREKCLLLLSQKLTRVVLCDLKNYFMCVKPNNPDYFPNLKFDKHRGVVELKPEEDENIEEDEDNAVQSTTEEPGDKNNVTEELNGKNEVTEEPSAKNDVPEEPNGKNNVIEKLYGKINATEEPSGKNNATENPIAHLNARTIFDPIELPVLGLTTSLRPPVEVREDKGNESTLSTDSSTTYARTESSDVSNMSAIYTDTTPQASTTNDDVVSTTIFKDEDSTPGLTPFNVSNSCSATPQPIETKTIPMVETTPQITPTSEPTASLVPVLTTTVPTTTKITATTRDALMGAIFGRSMGEATAPTVPTTTTTVPTTTTTVPTTTTTVPTTTTTVPTTMTTVPTTTTTVPTTTMTVPTTTTTVPTTTTTIVPTTKAPTSKAAATRDALMGSIFGPSMGGTTTFPTTTTTLPTTTTTATTKAPTSKTETSRDALMGSIFGPSMGGTTTVPTTKVPTTKAATTPHALMGAIFGRSMGGTTTVPTTKVPISKVETYHNTVMGPHFGRSMGDHDKHERRDKHEKHEKHERHEKHEKPQEHGKNSKSSTTVKPTHSSKHLTTPLFRETSFKEKAS